MSRREVKECAEENKVEAEEIFKNLTESAFDFLNQSHKNLNTDDPKYAVIHFAAAVEQIFKARLILINPIWIAKEPSDTAKKKLKDGKIRTVDLELAKKRIECLTKEPLNKKMFNKFHEIAQHRNRIIHFFHNDLREENTKEKITCELLEAWHFLYKLLNEIWSDCFYKCSEKIQEFATLFLKNRGLLESKYKEVKKKPNASTFVICPVCNYKSYDEKANNYGACHVCGYEIPTYRSVKDGCVPFEAACAWCDEDGTVIETEYGLKCTKCGSIFNRTDYIQCEYCGKNFVSARGERLDKNRNCDACFEYAVSE